MSCDDPRLQRLAELQAAKHALLTGTKEIEVTYNGMVAKYQAVDLSRLDMAIMALKSELGLGRRRAIGVRF